MKELTQELLEQAVTGMIGKEATRENLQKELYKLKIVIDSGKISLNKFEIHDTYTKENYNSNVTFFINDINLRVITDSNNKIISLFNK